MISIHHAIQLEKMQKRFTRMLPRLEDVLYKEIGWTGSVYLGSKEAKRSYETFRIQSSSKGVYKTDIKMFPAICPFFLQLMIGRPYLGKGMVDVI